MKLSILTPLTSSFRKTSAGGGQGTEKRLSNEMCKIKVTRLVIQIYFSTSMDLKFRTFVQLKKSINIQLKGV